MVEEKKPEAVTRNINLLRILRNELKRLKTEEEKLKSPRKNYENTLTIFKRQFRFDSISATLVAAPILGVFYVQSLRSKQKLSVISRQIQDLEKEISKLEKFEREKHEILEMIESVVNEGYKRG